MDAAEVFARIRRAPKGLYSQVVNLDTKPSHAHPKSHGEDMETDGTPASPPPTVVSVSMAETVGDDKEEGTASTVYESRIALLPACSKRHGNFKGKARADQPRRCETRARSCGRFDACDEAAMVPSTAGKKDFTISTNDPLHDLRRWLTTPNSRLAGGKASRSADFLRNERFKEEHLRRAIDFAIDEICYEHDHINSLVRYGNRAPYCLYFQSPVAKNANLNFFSMEAEHFEGVPREGLLGDLVEMAGELDYLRFTASQVGQKILDAKGRAAKLGDRSEIGELLRLEVVSGEWVQANCRMS